jgi:SNF2 family DNA or RNA helicase
MAISLYVTFQEKDEFKRICQEENVPYTWDSKEKKWKILTNDVPAFLKKYEQTQEKIHVIDCDYTYLPFAKLAGASWNKEKRVVTFKGQNVPVELSGFQPKLLSYGAKIERELNGYPAPILNPEKEIKLHAHQKTCSKLLCQDFTEKLPGFLVADETGLGKTIETWHAILEISKIENRALKILITGPIGAMEAWRETIRWMGSGQVHQKANEITLLNYDRLKALFKDDKLQAKSIKGVAKYGKPESFDIIVFDESHYLKNPDSGRTKLAKKLEEHAKFCIWISATAGQNPLELHYLSKLFAFLTQSKNASIETDYEHWCQKQGISLARGKFGKWNWQKKPEDYRILNQILYGKKHGAIRRTCKDIEGWPELQRIPRPHYFTPQEMQSYKTDWDTFLQALEEDKLDRLKGKKDTAKGIAQLGRLRQKASLLRIASTTALAEELLENGYQVAISVQYHKTLQALKETLGKNYKVGEFSGANEPDREEERKRYHAGIYDVLLFTVESSISLHQIQDTDKPKTQINHDLRWSGIQQEQIDGRSHRNGRHAPVYWCFTKDTIEEKVATILLEKLEGMNTIQGGNAEFEHIWNTITSL